MKPEYDEDRFANELADVLLADSAVEKVDFYIGPGDRLHVDGAGLRKMGDLIKEKRISIRVDDAYLDARKADATYEDDVIVVRRSWVRDEAQARESFKMAQKYLPNPDDAVFSDRVFTGSAMQRARLVHEATHALIDYREKNVYKVRNEVAAWLAGVIYLYHIRSITNVITGNEHFEQKLWVHAHEVATKQRLYLQKGIRLSRKNLQPLLGTVRKEYDYPLHARTPADGIE